MQDNVQIHSKVFLFFTKIVLQVFDETIRMIPDYLQWRDNAKEREVEEGGCREERKEVMEKVEWEGRGGGRQKKP